MSTLLCPKCQSANVKPVTVWQVTSASLNVTAPPRPMFACQELFCLHKWARQPNVEAVRLQTKWKNQGDQSCEHSTQRLINVAPADITLEGVIDQSVFFSLRRVSTMVAPTRLMWGR